MAVGKAKFTTLKDKARALYDAEQRYYLINNKFTNDKDKLDIYSKCSIVIDDSPYVSCSKKIFGKTVSHIKWLKSGAFSCLTYEVNNNNDITHRICQAESGRKTPNVCDKHNCQYLWR